MAVISSTVGARLRLVYPNTMPNMSIGSVSAIADAFQLSMLVDGIDHLKMVPHDDAYLSIEEELAEA